MTQIYRSPRVDRESSPAGTNLLAAVCVYALVATTVLLAACTTSTVAPPAVVTTSPVVPLPAAVVAPPPVPTGPNPAPSPTPPDTVAQAREPPPVELPDYAKRGKRLPASGGVPGRAVIAYCRSFEIEKDAQSYFKALQRKKRLPDADEIAERSRLAGQPQSVQQVVERDWALRRQSNQSAPQRCKVLGGSIDGATALIVFEAELNGRRQRGIATVLQNDKQWRVRDHGDWVQLK